MLIERKVAEELALPWEPIGFWRDAPEPDFTKQRDYMHAQALKDGCEVEIEDHHQALILRLMRRAIWVSRLPWPGDYLDPSMSDLERERDAILLDCQPVWRTRGKESWDRLEPTARNGSFEHTACGYVWPSGLSTYVRKYGLRLPPEFLKALRGE